jgi:hypothetical protein
MFGLKTLTLSPGFFNISYTEFCEDVMGKGCDRISVRYSFYFVLLERYLKKVPNKLNDE